MLKKQVLVTVALGLAAVGVLVGGASLGVTSTSSTVSASEGNVVTFNLAPPAGVPQEFAAASGKVQLVQWYENHPNLTPGTVLDTEVIYLPCAGAGTPFDSNQFYVAYLTTSEGTQRLVTFNSECFAGITTRIAPWLAPPLSLEEELTMDIYLESDDGEDGPDGFGILVLTGTYTP